MDDTGQHIQTASRVHRFRFASFDSEEEVIAVPAAEAAPAVVEEKLPEPMVTLQERVIKEEELHRARSEGHEQGYKEGVAATEARINKEQNQREETIKSILETMANRVTLAAAEHTAAMTGKQDLMGKAVIAIARKVAGEAIKTEPYAGVETMLKECSALIIGEPKITVTVPVGLSAGLRQRIDTMRPMLNGFSGQLNVEESEELKESDCRVEWNNGYAESDTAKLWGEIENIISRTRT